MTIGRTHRGTIMPGGDTDAYAFYGQAGQGVVIEMADLSEGGYYSWEGLEPRVQLYDPNGVRVADSGWDRHRAVIENYQLRMTGIYTVVASDEVGVLYADYWPERHPDTGEYGLSISVMPPKDPHGLYPCDPHPADGNSVSACDQGTLSWWPVKGATGYDVYFAAGPCAALERVAENVQHPWIPVPVVGNEPTCSWRVVAHTPSGDIEGPTWWFAVEPCESFTLAISTIGRGSIVDPNVGARSYPYGQVVPVTAVADPGFEFVRWEGSAVDANKAVVEYQDDSGSKTRVTVDGTYTLKAVFEEVVYDLPLDSDPGWTGNGQWQFGRPVGQGGREHGAPDPAGGLTGQNVFGVNLSGDYNTAMGSPCSLVAGPFDVSGHEDVELRFWRWLNTDWPEYVKNAIEISTDGQSWSLVWEQPQRQEIADAQWTLCEYPIPQADGQRTVYLRWSYQVVKERAYAYTGWNIDDIQLTGKPR